MEQLENNNMHIMINRIGDILFILYEYEINIITYILKRPQNYKRVIILSNYNSKYIIIITLFLSARRFKNLSKM